MHRLIRWNRKRFHHTFFDKGETHEQTPTHSSVHGRDRFGGACCNGVRCKKIA
jgi:hypothetical protein